MHDDDYDGSAGPFHPVFVFGGALALGLVLVMGLLAFWFTIVSPAAAHDAKPTRQQPLGWTYPSRSCWSASNAPAGRLGDCADIPNHAVKVGPDGYVVTLEPGEHPMVTERISYVIPYAEAEQSPDGRYHLCISSTLKRRCFFAGARMG
jgi:hypothetical protein